MTEKTFGPNHPNVATALGTLADLYHAQARYADTEPLPAQPTVDDDELLTASEVAQLKLNAEQVVLSGCNTIAGDKPGAEALSGLRALSRWRSRTGSEIRPRKCELITRR